MQAARLMVCRAARWYAPAPDGMQGGQMVRARLMVCRAARWYAPAPDGIGGGLQNAGRPRLRDSKAGGHLSAGGCRPSGKKHAFQPLQHFIFYGIVRRKICAFYFFRVMANYRAYHVGS